MTVSIAMTDRVFVFCQRIRRSIQYRIISSALGEVDCDQEMCIPSKQSMIGLKQTLLAGIENSVMSVSQGRLEATVWKVRFTKFSEASLILPLYEQYLRLIERLATRFSSFMIRQTIFSDTRIFSAPRAACTLRYP